MIADPERAPASDCEKDVRWPDPSPLQSWWDEVMRPIEQRPNRHRGGQKPAV